MRQKRGRQGMIRVRRQRNLLLRPDSRRSFFRPFMPETEERVMKIVARVMTLSEREVAREVNRIMRDFGSRHPHLRELLLRHFESIKDYLLGDRPLTEERRLLLGAYFTQEYALEAAALFNPSIVPHPNQEGVPRGALRFILSLRATGEGHLSSIVFRTGIVRADGTVEVDPPKSYTIAGHHQLWPKYERKIFERKLADLGLLTSGVRRRLESLGEWFTYEELEEIVREALREDRYLSVPEREQLESMLSVAASNYEVEFPPEEDLSARVIFPWSPTERHGIEDARFVAFQEEDGSVTYHATYTAVDGRVLLPQLLTTKDFNHFTISTLNGREVQNKGMALFPRKIGGRYVMLGRQDNENMFIMYSDLLHFWPNKRLLVRPTYPWEFVQLGNCGSPIETEAGWLVLTHGVGPMRRYVISAILLDREDPSRVVGRLKEPLLSPTGDESEGYVPNVVYSCGALVHESKLILPYAMSDQCTSFATVELSDLLEELLKHRP